MADELNDTPGLDMKPTPRRRKAGKSESAGESTGGNAARPAASAPKKAGATGKAPEPTSMAPETNSTERASSGLGTTVDKVGGARKAALIVGGLAVAGTAAALLLRSSTPRKGANDDAPRGKAHQPDGTDSSAQMDAMIADESMIPESTPQA